MGKSILIIGLFFSLCVHNVKAQFVVSQSMDTLMHFGNDFFPRYELFDRNGDQTVKRNGRILYVRILFDDTSMVRVEYFALNDSVFYREEFDRDGSSKARGEVTMTNSFDKIDTISTIDPNEPDKIIVNIVCYRKLVKSGKWEEYSADPYMLGDAWSGNYSNDKRIGIWDHFIDGYNGIFKIATFDYGKDSSKAIYSDNLIHSAPEDSVRKYFTGRWWVVSGNDPPDRNEWDKLVPVHGSYGDLFWYYDFNSGKKVAVNNNCNDSGLWLLSKEGDNYILALSFKDVSKNKKWKILYLDKQGFMVTQSI